MKAIFVDTSAWIALFHADDIFHQAAQEYYESLLARRIRLVTSDYVLDETTTWLRYDAGHRLAVEFYRLLMEAEAVKQARVLWVDREVTQEAWQLFLKYEDQKFSFTDCTSFVLTRRMGLAEVFAFDQHFAVMGFVVRP